MRHYDINDPAFNPNDIWENSSKEYEEEYLVSIKKFDKNKILTFATISGFYGLLDDPKHQRSFEGLRGRLEKGEPLGLPVIEPVFEGNTNMFIWIDGIHRTVLYLNMFDVSEVSFLVLGKKKKESI